MNNKHMSNLIVDVEKMNADKNGTFEMWKGCRMTQQTIDELRDMKDRMSICFESEMEQKTKDRYTLDKAIIACEQLRKARKKAKRWKRKFYELKRIYDDTATDRSTECNYCKYLDDPFEETCKNCYHNYTDKFKPNTKGDKE